ncbi:Tumor necrosis factor [Bagarius yarrelli]|uniref:Tumor necrosis factor n=1 Tax=Bagarius yarrelli TaxID=175774 RepID=A0A556TP01_BAGYA|nr:Tumor necrosis factor [Bagarius yarrelli]
MDSNSQVVLDVDASQVMFVREKATSASRVWRMCGVLLATALCAAAAVCFTVNKTQNKPDETQAEIKHSLRQISESAKAAIHLSGNYNFHFSNTSMKWTDDEDQSFASGLKLEDNHIKILRNGLYFVYSQASYHLICASDNEDSDSQVVHISHTVSRWSDSFNSWKPLLSATRSACEQTQDGYSSHWFGAIYLGAAFKLEAGDKLRTDMYTKLLSNIESASGKTFFGAFSL